MDMIAHSPLTFTMEMEVVIRGSKWVVDSKRLKSGVHLTPIRANMEDKITLTTTVPCTRYLLSNPPKTLNGPG